MRRHWTPRLVMSLVTATALAVTGCGSDERGSSATDDQPPPRSSEPSRPTPPAIADPLALQFRQSIAHRVGGAWHSVDDAMPNVRYVLDGEEVRMADLYVVGEVTSVVASHGNRWELDGEEERTIRVPFDSPDAMVVMLVVTVRVDRFISDGSTSDPGRSIRIAVPYRAPPVDLDAVRGELRGYGTMVFILGRSPEMTEGTGTPWWISLDGELFGYLDGERVVFPGLSDASMAPDDLTLSNLETPDSDEPIRLVERDGIVERRS
ncbi:MAG: hypothetical protein WKF45_05835 [Ilumatobacteraceae bacterium]